MPTNDQVILQQILEKQHQKLSVSLSESEFFELFACEQILKDHDLSWEEISSGIVGDGGDGGIDGFYLFVNGEIVREDTEVTSYHGHISIELHIIQAKRTSGFSEEAIQKLRSSTEELLDLSTDLSNLESVYNPQLLDAAGRFREVHNQYVSRLPDLAVSYYYATLGAEIHPNVQRQVNPLRETISRLFSSADFSFDFLGARKLLSLTRVRPRTTYELRFSDSISTVGNAYVCLILLYDYFKFITNEEGACLKSLFDANVRDYQGDVQVNLGIRKSLSEPQGEDFWWLNNGVTIVASKAAVSGKTLTLENPRVVNGLQTSLEIYRFFHESDAQDSESNLLVRVIVPEQSDSYERIIQATNSQTTIPIASLRATDRIHRDIEDYFKTKGLYYDRRKNQHKNEGKPLDRIASISYVAQAVMSVVLGRPDDARARPSTLLKRDEDYSLVFNPEYHPDIFLASTLLLRQIEDLLRADSDLGRKEINNTKFHLASFVTRLYLNELSPQPMAVAGIDVSALDDGFLSNCKTEVWNLYVELGGNDQVAKGTELVAALEARLGELTYKGRITGGHRES